MYLTTLRNENKYSISLLSIKILLSKQNFCHCWKNIFLCNLNTSSKTQIEPIREGTKHSVFGCELHTNVEQMCVYCYCCSQSSPAVKIYLNLITRSYYYIQYHTSIFRLLSNKNSQRKICQNHYFMNWFWFVQLVKMSSTTFRNVG